MYNGSRKRSLPSPFMKELAMVESDPVAVSVPDTQVPTVPPAAPTVEEVSLPLVSQTAETSAELTPVADEDDLTPTMPAPVATTPDTSSTAPGG